MPQILKKIYKYLFKRKQSQMGSSTIQKSQGKLMLHKAKLARATANYYKTLESIKQTVHKNPDNCTSQIEWLSAVLKFMLCDQRTAWRKVANIEKEEHQRNNINAAHLAHEYRLSIENNIKGNCEGILQLLDEELLTRANMAETKVLYYKLKGDFQKYICEFELVDKHQKPLEQVSQSYDIAKKLADSDLSKTHPLNLALHLSICCYKFDTLKDCTAAIAIAQTFLGEVIADIDHINPAHWDESIFYLQLLKDNLSLWKKCQPISK